MYGVLQETPRIWIVGKCSEEIQVIRVQWGPTGEMLSDLNRKKKSLLKHIPENYHNICEK